MDKKYTTVGTIASSEIVCISIRVKSLSINLFFVACSQVIVSNAPAIAKINSQIQRRMTPLEEIIERRNAGSQAPHGASPSTD